MKTLFRVIGISSILAATIACTPRVSPEWKWMHDGGYLVSHEDYQLHAACEVLHILDSHNCRDLASLQPENQKLHKQCDDDQLVFALGPLLNAIPQPPKIESLSDAKLSPIDIISALKKLAAKVDLHYVLDVSNRPIARGRFVDVTWNTAFMQLLGAGGFRMVSSCHAVALGRKDRILEQSAELAEISINSVAGKTGEANYIQVKPENCGSRYSGRKFDFVVEEAPLDLLFAEISEVSNLNFLLTPSVQGTISVMLPNTPWDEALDLILATFGLDKIQDGNIVRIAPVDELKDERERLTITQCTD